MVGFSSLPTYLWFCFWCFSVMMKWNHWLHGDGSHYLGGSLKILPVLYPISRHRWQQTHSLLCLMLLSSSIAWFMVGAIWKKHFWVLIKVHHQSSLCQVITTLWTAPVRFLYDFNVLKSLSTYSAGLVNFINPFLELFSVCSIVCFNRSKHGIICFIFICSSQFIERLPADSSGWPPWFLVIWTECWPDLSM